MTAADAMRMLATLLVGVEDGLIELRPIRPSGGAGSPEFISVSEKPRVSERAVALRADFNVYFGVAPRTRARGNKDAVGLVPAVWADLDSQVARQSLDAFELPPSIVVSSGSGENCHAYWVLEQPVEPAVAEEINRALAARLGSDERVVDAGRVLRLPGTLNHKTSPPSEVRLEHLDARRFTHETLRAALGDAGAGQEQAAQPDEISRPVALVLARLMGNASELKRRWVGG